MSENDPGPVPEEAPEPKRIEVVWLFVDIAPNGDESTLWNIVAPETQEPPREAAQRMANRYRRRVLLLRFTDREEIEIVEPEPEGDSPP